MSTPKDVKGIWQDRWGNLPRGTNAAFLADERVKEICRFRRVWIEESIANHQDLDEILDVLASKHAAEVKRLEQEAKQRASESVVIQYRNDEYRRAYSKAKRASREARELKQRKRKLELEERKGASRQVTEPFMNPAVNAVVQQSANASRARSDQLEEERRRRRRDYREREARLETGRLHEDKSSPGPVCTGCGQPIKATGLCGCS